DDHAGSDMRAVADRRPPGHDAHAVAHGETAGQEGVLVQERQGTGGLGGDDAADLEPEQDPLLDPAVDAPAVRGRLRRPGLPALEGVQELVEDGARLVAERLRGQRVVALDLAGQVLAHAHETSSSSLSAARMASRVLS